MTLERRHMNVNRNYNDWRPSTSPLNMRYVIQQHKARNNHWDLRLQVGNKMMSWAVPKGPSLNPAETRLAIKTKPHGIEYSGFEGVIQKGLYGAGKVIQWDKGTYSMLDDSGEMTGMMKDGLVKFELHGEKLKGKWALVKMNKEWLLIKMNDPHARKDVNIIKSKPKSVKSGKTISEITEEDGLIQNKKNLGWD